ncbi:hypothetical protein H5410_038138 [Solanum commersonii]|uniref:Uncharacterized protein n=1 Tax=Solanum commersonii TaxID=4109 RepID=A0A9J5Y9W2_SOLCO|nr:hypothetical protein H5410_038138 [Solanum commersonii]
MDFTIKPRAVTKVVAPLKPTTKRLQETHKEKGKKKPKIVEEVVSIIMISFDHAGEIRLIKMWSHKTRANP